MSPRISNFLSLCLLTMSSQPCLAVTELLFVSVNAHLTDTRLDPIVTPGEWTGSCPGHMHSVYGSNDFASIVSRRAVADADWRNDTGKDLQTTSNVIPNKSMYWAPSMYIFNPKDQMYYIVPSFARTYYRLERPNRDVHVNPFPLNLRIVPGDATRREPWATTEARDAIKWTNRTFNRMDTNSSHHGDWSYLKMARKEDIGYMDQLEMNIRFPNCLRLRKGDGEPRTMSRDHRSHAAYMKRNGCPESHPYLIPVLDLEVRYLLKDMRELLGAEVVDNTDNWFMATGDRTGSSAHADFIAGWPEELMENIIHSCRSGKAFGKGECYLEKYMTQSRRVMQAKTIPFTNEVPAEVVSPVHSLPNINDPCCIGC